jgi:hypothetical protein
MARDESRNTFERRLDILIFAVFMKRDVTVSEVIEYVLEATRMTIRNCLKDLVSTVYMEKTGIYTYKASAKANGLFGVKDA